jgi:pimeloyl-ACP methyl ester carboxylesterase
MQSSPTNSARELLREFRATHSVFTRAISGHVWDLIDGGQGEPALVLLPGGGGSAESQFHLISLFEKHVRVLSIGCPATVTSIGEVVQGLARVLDEHEIARCFLLGHSLGGVFAQAFAAAHPERVRGLIFANTAAYSPRRGRFVGAALRSARYLPKRLVASYLNARVRRLLGNHRDREFWVEYFAGDEFGRVGVEGAANRGRCVADSVANAPAKAYAGPVLIIESDNETGFTPAERTAFKRSYPQAALRTFHAAGHLASITRRDEFVAEVLGFLERTQPPVPR